MGGALFRSAFALAVVAAFAGCDSRAKASDPQGGRAESKSKEYESCGASMHCQDDLRCFDNVCRRTARSAVGDYFAALGTQLRAKGEQHPIEKTGRELRKLMSWVKSHDADYTEGTATR